MKDFHHSHILGLLGVCFDAPDGNPYIVLPFMANGSVCTYLKEKRAHVLDVDSIPKVYILSIMKHLVIRCKRNMAIEVLSMLPLLQSATCIIMHNIHDYTIQTKYLMQTHG